MVVFHKGHSILDTMLDQSTLSTGNGQAEDVDAITAAMDSAVFDSEKDL